MFEVDVNPESGFRLDLDLPQRNMQYALQGRDILTHTHFSHPLVYQLCPYLKLIRIQDQHQDHNQICPNLNYYNK